MKDQDNTLPSDEQIEAKFRKEPYFGGSESHYIEVMAKRSGAKWMRDIAQKEIDRLKGKEVEPINWISVKKELPKITDDQSFVTVMVRTVHGGIGECVFGYSGAMGEPMSGSFWRPIRNFKGEVHFKNEIIDWAYKSHLQDKDNNQESENGK